jgi:hypothetical protein
MKRAERCARDATASGPPRRSAIVESRRVRVTSSDPVSAYRSVPRQGHEFEPLWGVLNGPVAPLHRIFLDSEHRKVRSRPDRTKSARTIDAHNEDSDDLEGHVPMAGGPDVSPLTKAAQMTPHALGSPFSAPALLEVFADLFFS